MRNFKTWLIAAVVLSAIAAPSNAKSVWEQIGDSSPLHPIFDTLRDTAPRSVFDQLNETAPREAAGDGATGNDSLIGE